MKPPFPAVLVRAWRRAWPSTAARAVRGLLASAVLFVGPGLMLTIALRILNGEPVERWRGWLLIGYSVAVLVVNLPLYVRSNLAAIAENQARKERERIVVSINGRRRLHRRGRPRVVPPE